MSLNASSFIYGVPYATRVSTFAIHRDSHLARPASLANFEAEAGSKRRLSSYDDKRTVIADNTADIEEWNEWKRDWEKAN